MCGLVISRSPMPDAWNAVAHRGLRTSTAMTDRGDWLFHARLPIVGTDAANDQPNGDSPRWLIAFVGELLDFREHSPTASCDFATVVKTWIEDGPEGFRNFDGFWSIVVLDKTTGDIHLLVDYLAQKPLYYRTDVQGAASEPYAAALIGPVTPDELYFSSVAKWGYCPDPHRTPYNEVRKMLPGEYLVIRRDGTIRSEIIDRLRPNPAWDLKMEITQAVKRRVLSADVPVAALVSGGLDSAIVYTLAKRYGTVVPYHVENGERKEAYRVLKNDTHHYVPASTDPPSHDDQLAVMQEPIDLGSLVPQMMLSNTVKERVCLTGDGADELFGGYGRSLRYDSQYSDVFHELVCWHLPRLDRVMMRNRIEVRSPFLARGVAEAALALPYSMRQDKNHLRDLFRDDLPPGVADTPKKPLRTDAVGEANRLELIRLFREKTWPT